MEDNYYSIHTVAGKLQVAYLTIYRWIRAGKVKAYKIGKQYRIKERDFNTFVEKNRAK